jgi:hypothetical protein
MKYYPLVLSYRLIDSKDSFEILDSDQLLSIVGINATDCSDRRALAITWQSRLDPIVSRPLQKPMKSRRFSMQFSSGGLLGLLGSPGSQLISPSK